MTAKEFLLNKSKSKNTYIVKNALNNGEFTIDIMIEFAKYHVQEALKCALEEIPYGGSDEVRYEDVVGILNCYPLENIK